MAKLAVTPPVVGSVRIEMYRPPMSSNRASAADVFAMPSFNEGMSNAMLEAMASGLPVVVTRTPGVAEVVREDGNGLVHDWADQAALNGHLLRLARDPALRARLGQAARATAESLSWSTAAREYQNLFQTLARRP